VGGGVALLVRLGLLAGGALIAGCVNRFAELDAHHQDGIVKKLHDPVSDESSCLFRRHSTNRAALMQQASPINTKSRANNTPALVVRISVVMVLSIFINQ
jgi:hypothetical protein